MISDAVSWRGFDGRGIALRLFHQIAGLLRLIMSR